MIPSVAGASSAKRRRLPRNQPNIVTIHAVEQAGETAFLAMELVEGRPLSEVIPRGGMRFDQLLKIAIPSWTRSWRRIRKGSPTAT